MREMRRFESSRLKAACERAANEMVTKIIANARPQMGFNGI
jgi:hypothetical protein